MRTERFVDSKEFFVEGMSIEKSRSWELGKRKIEKEPEVSLISARLAGIASQLRHDVVNDWIEDVLG